jgi:hypothetical protein
VRSSFLLVVGALALAATIASGAAAQTPTDARSNLAPGFLDAGTASNGLQHLANRPKTTGWFNPNNPGDFGFLNSDIALEGDHAFVGNFNGFQIYDISDPASPTLVTQVVCPGGQGEVSVFGNLLFMSAEETRARTDCGAPAVPSGDPLRFRGVRIFDIANVASPVQVATVQSCRGSHTHTLLKHPGDAANIYVYINGTGSVRSATELPSCVNAGATNPNSSLYRIEVIKVPLAAPQNAAIVSEPRLFTDPVTGAMNGLQNTPPDHFPNTPGLQHPSGIGWSPSPTTDSCHDVTTYPALGIAAGACEGNGLLLDISDPANPKRLDAVADPNWAYWHGATFSNDGKTVIFTDEWGGGLAPRCRATDQAAWGGNAIYDIVDSKLVFRSYFKLPSAQVDQENCVSHLPSLVPVPGRDVMVQAWYQGGASLIDFTDSANPREIGYFDRGPVSGTSLVFGGFWSTYYYNGGIFASDLARGFDTLKLTPTAELSQNEIDAAAEVVLPRLTPQHQPQLVNQPSFAVVRSFRDQAVRADAIDDRLLKTVDHTLDLADNYAARGLDERTARKLNELPKKLKTPELAALREAVLALIAKYS